MRPLNDEQLLRSWRGPEPVKNPNNNWIKDYIRQTKAGQRDIKIKKIIKRINDRIKQNIQ